MTRRHKRTLFAGTIATLTIATIAAWFAYSSDAATPPPAAPLPQVVVSTPLAREVDSTLGFLGQFSAIEQVELRAQVGGTLTGVYFKDGDIVHKGDLLFTIDARPYEIRLAQAKAQLETAAARLALAERELNRAQVLVTKSFGTQETVDQRTAEQRSAQAAVDDAKAQIRDAEFVIAHPDGCTAGLWASGVAASGKPFSVERIASSAAMPCRRAVSITERMSA